MWRFQRIIMFKQVLIYFAIAVIPTLPPGPIYASGELPNGDMRINERLGERADIENLEFMDESGKNVKLSQYFSSGKPVFLTFVYYKCPGICNYLLNGFVNSLRALEYSAGKEFEIVTLSINPKEDSKLAAEKKATYLKEYGRLEAEKGWHWLVGREDQIAAFAKQAGFGFRYDEATGEFAHSAGIFVMTPDGRFSRVLFGVDYPYRDLKLALLEASEGKIGTVFDRVMMFCYRYDPFTKGYGVHGLRLMQLLSTLMILGMGFYLYRFWSRDRRRHNQEPQRS